MVAQVTGIEDGKIYGVLEVNWAKFTMGNCYCACETTAFYSHKGELYGDPAVKFLVGTIGGSSQYGTICCQG